MKGYRLKTWDFPEQPGILREGKVEVFRIGKSGIPICCQIIFHHRVGAGLWRNPQIARPVKQVIPDDVIVRNRGMRLAC